MALYPYPPPLLLLAGDVAGMCCMSSSGISSSSRSCREFISDEVLGLGGDALVRLELRLGGMVVDVYCDLDSIEVEVEVEVEDKVKAWDT